MFQSTSGSIKEISIKSFFVTENTVQEGKNNVEDLTIFSFPFPKLLRLFLYFRKVDILY